MRRRAVGCALLGMVVALGCSDEGMPRPDCIELRAACAPFFTPTFDNLFENTFAKKCGDANACHNAVGRKGGLVFENPDEAYDLLLGNVGPKSRVTAGKPQCSELVVRTHVAGEDWSMPPGHPLHENEQCVIRQWIEQGALRR